VHPPETVLFGGTERELRRGGRMRVNVGEGKIDEDPVDLAGRDLLRVSSGAALV